MSEITKPNYDWIADAACKGHPRDWWFPDFPVNKKVYIKMRQAIEICRQCPVNEECLNHALEWEQFGIWGGVTERRRMAMRRSIGIKVRSTVDAVGPIRYRN
jgi:WhiB family redox-sensing transcriptional regulator